MKIPCTKKSAPAPGSLKGYDSVLSGFGWPAITIYATLLRKCDQIEQTQAAESRKCQIVPPPSPQFISIMEQVDPDVFPMMVGKSETPPRKSKISQTEFTKLNLCFRRSAQQSYGCRI